MKALGKLYKKVICLHSFKRTCWFFNNALHTFKMWLNEYFLNSWHHNCETSMKMYWKSLEKLRKCIEKSKCSCNLCLTKVDNNLEITSVRSSLDLGNKIWIWKPFIDMVCHFKKPRLGCSFLPPVSFEII